MWIHTFEAASSASFFFRSISSTLRGCRLCAKAHPAFLFFASIGGGGGSPLAMEGGGGGRSSGGGGGAEKSGGGGGAARSGGGGGTSIFVTIARRSVFT